MKGKCIMFQGTGSSVGKSLLTAGFLRILKQDGYLVAPFKSQNMALNSFVTKKGDEMGRAQVVQAEAAGIEPDCIMNPILIKPTADSKAQVILDGKVYKNLNAIEYHEMKDILRSGVKKAYDKLEREYDYVVIEGAGSPAEINLSENDIVNMGMAAIADSPVILIGDIDKGGVFASLYGTIKLLKEDEQKRIKAVIINKFRGDIEILRSGLKMLEDLIEIPVLGVIPYVDIDIEDEDSVTERLSKNNLAGAYINIGIVKLPYMSNFTDFNMLYRENGVGVEYISRPEQLESKDMVIIPGSKNTIYDLVYLQKMGFDNAIRKFAEDGGYVMGICGGYQMLGKNIFDLKHVETDSGEAQGLGLLDIDITMKENKITTQAKGKIFQDLSGLLKDMGGCDIDGYEIHMGQNDFGDKVTKAGYIYRRNGQDTDVLDMVCNKQGNVLGTYLHGIFDNGVFLRGIINNIRKSKGLKNNNEKPISFDEFKEIEYNKLAQIVRSNIDMDLFYEILKGN